MTASASSASSRTRRLSKGRTSRTSPPRPPTGRDRRLGRLRRARAPRAGAAPGLDRAAQELRRVPAHRRRRSGPPAPLPGRPRPGAPLDVTEPGRDVWRPAVATAGDGSVVVVWTEKRDDNWDLFGRRYDPKTSAFSPEQRLTDRPGPDTRRRPRHRAPTAPSGWPGKRGPTARPTSCWPRSTATASPARRPSRSARRRPTSGRPRIAADTSGRVHVAFDSLPGGQLRRLAPHPRARRHAQPRDHRGRHRRARGPAQRGRRPPRPGLGRLRGTDAQLGQGRRQPARRQGLEPLSRRARSWSRCVDGGRVLHAPDPLEHAPDSLKNDEQLSHGWPSIARAGPG